MVSECRSPESSVYYYHGRHSFLPSPTAETRKLISGYHYRCFKAGETAPPFRAHNFRKGHAASVFLSEGAPSPDLILKLRKSFPVTGKIDLIDNRNGGTKGVVTRGRKVYDASESLLARFVDPRSWKAHLGESVIDAVGNLVFSGGDAPSQTDGADRFVLVADQTVIGGLSRERLPFFPDPPKRTKPRPMGKVLKKVLPKTVGRALFDITPPLGWKFDVVRDDDFDDTLLLLCAALMVVDIRRW